MDTGEYLNPQARDSFVNGIIDKFADIQFRPSEKSIEKAKFAAVGSLLSRWNGDGTRDVPINRAEVEAGLAAMPGRDNPKLEAFIKYIDSSVTSDFDNVMTWQKKQVATEQKETRQFTPETALQVMKWYEDHITYDSARKSLNVKALAGASEPHLVGTALKALGAQGHSYDGKGVAGNTGTVSVSNAESLAQTLADNGLNFQGRAGIPSKRVRAGGEG